MGERFPLVAHTVENVSAPHLPKLQVDIEVCRDFAGVLGVELGEPGEGTTARDFQRKHQKNQAYYRLARGL